MGMTTQNLANLVTMSNFMGASINELSTAVAVNTISDTIQKQTVKSQADLANLSTQLGEQQKKAQAAADAAEKARVDAPATPNYWDPQGAVTGIYKPNVESVAGDQGPNPPSVAYKGTITGATASSEQAQAQDKADKEKYLAQKKAFDDYQALATASNAEQAKLADLKTKKEKTELNATYNNSLDFLSSFSSQSPFLQTKALGDKNFAALFQSHSATVKAYQTMEMMNKKYDLSVAVANNKAAEHYQKGASQEGAQAIASFTDYITKNNLVATNDREAIAAAAAAVRPQLKTEKDRELFQKEYDSYVKMGNARETFDQGLGVKKAQVQVGQVRNALTVEQIKNTKEYRDNADLRKDIKEVETGFGTNMIGAFRPEDVQRAITLSRSIPLKDVKNAADLGQVLAAEGKTPDQIKNFTENINNSVTNTGINFEETIKRLQDMKLKRLRLERK